MSTIKKPKKVASYRFSDPFLTLLKQASEATGLSESEILEKCVLEKVVEVVTKNVTLAPLLENDAVIDAFKDDLAGVIKELYPPKPNVPEFDPEELRRSGWKKQMLAAETPPVYGKKPKLAPLREHPGKGPKDS